MSESRSKILDKAKKLKELADRGIDGEMENAKAMLKQYMEKHKITMSEIERHNYSNSMFKGMSDEQFMNEIFKDFLAFGIGWLISAFFGKKVAKDFKNVGLNELNKKYSSELNNRKRT